MPALCPPAQAWSASHWSKVGYKIVTGWLGFSNRFARGSPSGVRHMNFFYSLVVFGTRVGWYKEREDDSRVAFVPQPKPKSKCITSINVRKSSAFISMQCAWKASRDDTSQKGFKGCFRITKKQSIFGS